VKPAGSLAGLNAKVVIFCCEITGATAARSGSLHGKELQRLLHRLDDAVELKVPTGIAPPAG
jgi:hypothetical protein